MSVFTAFRLSAKNLISKKGRTAMVGFAGSIGIIGIALVLAFSAGIKGYIASMQDDMLSGNPITISKTAFDMGAISDMMDAEDKIDIIKNPNQVYISSVIEHLIKTQDDLGNIMVENEITQEYVDYVKAMPSEYYNALTLGYGLDLTKTIFTDFYEFGGQESRHISVKQLTDIYKSVISGTDYKDLAGMVDRLAPGFSQAPDNLDYISSQYDVVAGEIADEKDEIMLVLDANDELTDLLLRIAAKDKLRRGTEFKIQHSEPPMFFSIYSLCGRLIPAAAIPIIHAARGKSNKNFHFHKIP